MHVEKALINEARQRVNGQSAGRQAYVESRIADWYIACLLSRGGNPERSAHWQRKAIEIRVELEAIAGRKFAESIA